jgi:small subunit ribosomal protein S18
MAPPRKSTKGKPGGRGGRPGSGGGRRAQQQNALFKRRKFCRFTAEKVVMIDYKDIETLRDFVHHFGAVSSE